MEASGGTFFKVRMRAVSSCFLALLWVSVVAAAQQSATQAPVDPVTRAVCEPAATALKNSGASEVTLIITVDSTGRVRSFRTEFPKNLKLEKNKDAANAVKSIKLQPAKKDGRPVEVMIRMAFNCSTLQPPTPQ